MKQTIKLILPENISDITLQQFQRYNELLEREDISKHEFVKRKIQIFTDLRHHELDNVSNKDFKDIDKQIETALNQNHKFTDRFTMHNIEFGFIPNLDEMSRREFVDTSLYPLEEVNNMHKLMAILFRPVTKSTGKQYEIETYRGTKKYCELMKQTPMHIVNGALVFFYNLQKELLNHTQRFTVEALKKEVRHLTSLNNGVGMPLSLN